MKPPVRNADAYALFQHNLCHNQWSANGLLTSSFLIGKNTATQRAYALTIGSSAGGPRESQRSMQASAHLQPKVVKGPDPDDIMAFDAEPSDSSKLAHVYRDTHAWLPKEWLSVHTNCQ